MQSEIGRNFTHAALGAAAGLTGTFLLQGVLWGHRKWLPETLPPMKADPGRFMVQKAERALPKSVSDALPEKIRSIASRATHLGYGASFGAAYGSVRGGGGSPVLDGSLLGLAAWAAGYLGWLPAAGLMSPPWKHRPAQAALPVIEHALFGIATVAAYDVLHHFIHPYSET